MFDLRVPIRSGGSGCAAAAAAAGGELSIMMTVFR